MIALQISTKGRHFEKEKKLKEGCKEGWWQSCFIRLEIVFLNHIVSHLIGTS